MNKSLPGFFMTHDEGKIIVTHVPYAIACVYLDELQVRTIRRCYVVALRLRELHYVAVLSVLAFFHGLQPKRHVSKSLSYLFIKLID